MALVVLFLHDSLAAKVQKPSLDIPSRHEDRHRLFEPAFPNRIQLLVTIGYRLNIGIYYHYECTPVSRSPTAFFYQLARIVITDVLLP